RRLVPAERAREIRLDALLRVPLVLVAELDADPRRALALGALRRDPDHPAGDRNLLLLAHQAQQHEDLVAELVARVRRNEQSAVFHERHVREIKCALVLDRQCQQPGFGHDQPRSVLKPNSSPCRANSTLVPLPSRSRSRCAASSRSNSVRNGRASHPLWSEFARPDVTAFESPLRAARDLMARSRRPISHSSARSVSCRSHCSATSRGLVLPVEMPLRCCSNLLSWSVLLCASNAAARNRARPATVITGWSCSIP